MIKNKVFVIFSIYLDCSLIEFNLNKEKNQVLFWDQKEIKNKAKEFIV